MLLKGDKYYVKKN